MSNAIPPLHKNTNSSVATTGKPSQQRNRRARNRRRNRNKGNLDFKTLQNNLPTLKLTVRRIGAASLQIPEPEEGEEREDGVNVNNKVLENSMLKLIEELIAGAGLTNVSSRVVYVVPPKTSKRRGEVPGYVMLLLTVDPSLITNVFEKSTMNAINNNDNNSNNDGNNAEHSETLANKEKNNKMDVDMEEDAKKNSNQMIISSAVKSQVLASAKLALINALESLQNFGTTKMVVVEVSRSQKSFKSSGAVGNKRVEKLMGSIERSEGFKDFMSAQQKAEEDRQGRKKPAPGGVSVSETDAQEEKVAVLVEYLQAKRDAEKKAKQAKKAKAKAAKQKSMKTMDRAIVRSNNNIIKLNSSMAAADASTSNNKSNRKEKLKKKRSKKGNASDAGNPLGSTKPTSSEANIKKKKKNSKRKKNIQGAGSNETRTNVIAAPMMILNSSSANG